MNHLSSHRMLKAVHCRALLAAAAAMTMVTASGVDAAQPSSLNRPHSQHEVRSVRERAPAESERVTWRVVPKDANLDEVRTAGSLHHDDLPDVSSASHNTIEQYSYEDHSRELACDEFPCDCNDCESQRRPNAPNDAWFQADYLLWSLSPMELPPLVTSSSLGTTPANSGILGRAGTQTLFGNDDVGDSLRSGGSFSLGWRGGDDSQSLGIEFRYLGIGNDSQDFQASSGTNGILARPVFDILLGAEASMLIAHPDFLSGDVSVIAKNDLQAFDVLGRKCVHRNSCERIDFLIGYRHGQMDEMLRVDQSSTYTSAQGQIIAGTTVSLFDSFDVENRFHGGQLGFQFQKRSGAITIDVLAKVGLGANRAEVTIDGATITSVPGGGSSTFAGGLLAQQTNIGSYEETDFSVMPETRIALKAQLNKRTQVSIGYGFLYWSGIARVTDQIDRQVSQFPPEPVAGGGSPQFSFETAGLLAHGLQVGLHHRF